MTQRILKSLLACVLALLALGAVAPSAEVADGGPTCRFGITAPLGFSGHEDKLAELEACSLLTWGIQPPSNIPQDMNFVHVIRVDDARYPTPAELTTLVQQYPSGVWQVGNEPDTQVWPQDNVTPEVYAQRYHETATLIRSLDATATLVFGSIVQPTPVRLRYLERAWIKLIELAGSQQDASDLIDVWSIHNFLLNEWPAEAGTGVPLGFECEYIDDTSPVYGYCWDFGTPRPDTCTPDICWPMDHITNFDDTHSNTKFNQRVRDMRDWMLPVGERDKPLWITEYGSLFPPIDPPGGPDLENVSDADTAQFMTGTFDFLLTATDAATGDPNDEDRLVQRWYWYSLNEYRYVYGGTLYDPDNNHARTAVGDAWVAYRDQLKTTWYLAEGFTDAGFGTYILIQNPADFAAEVDVTYMLQGGGVEERFVSVPARSRYTIVAQDPDQVGPGQAFSTMLQAEQPIIVERAMYFGNGGHNTIGVTGPASEWYLAEGFTGAGFGTFILLQNPNSASATVDVTYMLQGGGTIPKQHVVDGNSRYTIVAQDPAEVGVDEAFSTYLSSDQPIIVERAMYWADGGHDTIGVTSPATGWYLAEGYTGAGFGTYILLQNPNSTDATVDVTYMLQGGGTLNRQHVVPGNSRYTIVAQDAGEVGPDEAFSTKLVSDKTIIVERAMYFGNGGHNTIGVTSPATTWYLAEGYTGAGFGTYILLQNPNSTDATVDVTYMLQGGGTISRQHVVPGNSRYTIVAQDAGEVGVDQAFSTKLVSDKTIIVERAMYFGNGGHNTIGVSQ